MDHPSASIFFTPLDYFSTKELQCVHCGIAHRKTKRRNHSRKQNSLDRLRSHRPALLEHSRTRPRSRSRSRHVSLDLNSLRLPRQASKTLCQPSTISSLVSLFTILLLVTSPCAVHSGATVLVRSSPITSVTPRTNLTNGLTSRKSFCNIGLLVPAVLHDSAASDSREDMAEYLKQGTHWYSADVVQTVQDALDEAALVRQADSGSGGAGKKRGGTAVKGEGRGCPVKVEWRDGGWCDEKSALGQIVALHMAQDNQAFVGPPCHNSLRVVGLLASFWAIPVITWEPVLREVVGDKAYDNVFSVYGAFEDFAMAAAAVIENLKWTKIAILYEDSPLCGPLIEQLGHQMLEKNLADEAVKILLPRNNTANLGNQLRQIKTLTRTLVTCSRQSTLLNVLAEASKAGMTNGYYAFLHLSFDVSPLTTKISDRERSPLDVVLQLGQFHTSPERGVRDQGEEENKKEEEYRMNQTRLVREVEVTRKDMSPLDSQHILASYLHDAVIVATVASQAGRKRFSHEPLNVGPPYHLKTGPINFDEQGIRKATFSLFQRLRSGEMVEVAKIASNQNTTWLREIVWQGGHVPVSDITCRGNDTCIDVPGIIAGVTMGILILFLLFALAGYFYRKHKRRLAAAKREWLVDDRDVKRRRAKLPMSNGFPNGAGSNMETVKRLVRMETRGTLGLGSNCSLDKNMLYAPIGNYKDMVVAVKHVRWTHVQIGKKEMLEDLTTVKELSHDNVNQFVGAHVSTEPGSSYVLFRYCSKGSLQDVLANEDIKLDWMFKLSFALDLARGVEYIHKTALRSHGNLKSSNCVIDSRWVLKVTDYGAITSYRKPGSEDDLDNKVYFSSLLWTAPELLRMSKRPHKGTQKGDVYSVGIILQEILFRCAPYFFNYMEAEDIITLVKNEMTHRVYRPVVPPDNELPPRAINLMVACWSEASDSRPDIHQIRKRVRDLNGSKRFNIMDNMLLMLESYSSNLEQLVTDRTEELEAEKRKTDSLLYQMLPPLVAEQLKSGMSVTPESYDQVSIFFSDIVGFTAIASQSRPLEVVDLLNDLYTCFDEVIARRDVYKVETIGDAYMCVSGCPRRNGNRHAGEIANMALDLISAVTHFRIRHKPEEQLNLRVGLHTGACAAGVVGRTMPRYCLFGDTVNMASRMESTGKALHIHMSSQMKDSLDELDWGFLTVERGFIEVKGKGLQKTFWLAGKKNYKKPLPESLFVLQKRLEDGDIPPTPSYTTLTVGDSMFSALRKTSITVSNITVKNSPCTSDTEDAGGGADGLGDHGVGGVNANSSQYGNLLDASVRQHHGKKKSGERKSAARGRFEDLGDGALAGRGENGGFGRPADSGSQSKAGSTGERKIIPGEEKKVKERRGNGSSGRLDKVNSAVGVLSKPRKSLGEIGGAWNTVESCDSDPEVTPTDVADDFVNAVKVLVRPPPAAPTNKIRSSEGQGRGVEDKEVPGVDLASLGENLVGFSSHFENGEEEALSAKRNRTKHQGESESFELSPSSLKRKRAVVSPPRLVLIQSDLSDSTLKDGSYIKDSDIPTDDRKLPHRSNQDGNGSLRRNSGTPEELESDTSDTSKIKSQVKKDSACYSMADSVGDTFEAAPRQLENGSIQNSITYNISANTASHCNTDNNNYIKAVSTPGHPAHFPPILHVTASSPGNSPTGLVGSGPSSGFTNGLNTDDLTGSSHDGPASSFMSYDGGNLGSNTNSSVTSASVSRDLPLVSHDREYTPVTFDMRGSEFNEASTSPKSPSPVNDSAPVITVQQEDGRHSGASKAWDVEASKPPSPENVSQSSLSKSNEGSVRVNGIGAAQCQTLYSVKNETPASLETDMGGDFWSNWTGPHSENERNHAWFPQPNGKDFLVQNHHSSTHPALITVHNEDCPAASATSKQRAGSSNTGGYTQTMDRSRDVTVGFIGNHRTDMGSNGAGSSKISWSNGKGPVKTARRKHKGRRGRSSGDPDELPKIEIT